MDLKEKESLINKQERAARQQELLEKKRRARAEYNTSPARSEKKTPGRESENRKKQKKEINRKIFSRRISTDSVKKAVPEKKQGGDCIRQPMVPKHMLAENTHCWGVLCPYPCIKPQSAGGKKEFCQGLYPLPRPCLSSVPDSSVCCIPSGTGICGGASLLCEGLVHRSIITS